MVAVLCYAHNTEMGYNNKPFPRESPSFLTCCFSLFSSAYNSPSLLFVKTSHEFSACFFMVSAIRIDTKAIGDISGTGYDWRLFCSSLSVVRRMCHQTRDSVYLDTRFLEPSRLVYSGSGTLFIKSSNLHQKYRLKSLNERDVTVCYKP